MNAVGASLKPLLTCPSFMLWHGFGALACLPGFLYAWASEGSYAGSYVSAFLIPAWSGFVVASLQRDLAGSPFSFTLPGHRQALRSAQFLAGLAASLAASLAVITYPGLGGLPLLAAIFSALCFGLILFLVTVQFVFLMRSAAAALAIAVAASATLIEWDAARAWIQDVALFAPLWNTLGRVVIAAVCWRRMGDAALGRRLCSVRFLSLQNVWRRSAGEEFGADRLRETLTRSRFGLRRAVLGKAYERIHRHPVLSLRRHLAATRYQLAGQVLPLSWSAMGIPVLFALAFLTATGYAPPREQLPELPMANYAYLLTLVAVLSLPVPVFGSMLLPVGRRQRFWGALMIAGGHGLVVLGASLSVFLLLRIGEAVAPPLTLGGKALSFRPADLEVAFLPLVLLPLSILVKLTCRRWLLVPEILLVGITALVIVKGGAMLRDAGPIGVGVPILLAWALMALVLHSICFRRDLVQN